MSIIIPEDYHIRGVLQERRIHCMSQGEAQRQDIRPLRIGILNIMPKAESYEYNLLFPLGRSIIQIEPVWLRFNAHSYTSSSWSHLEHFYITFDQAVRSRGFDGLIITGAPVEELAFEEVSYWNELTEVLSYAREHIVSTLGICWGGLALAKYLGMEKMRYPKKLFGVFQTRNIDRTHRVTGELDDIFWCPQSRHSGILDEVMEEQAEAGTVRLLAHEQQGGYTIFESGDGKYIMHLGHPEYQSERLIEEYRRDAEKGRLDVAKPENLDLDHPVNRWRSHGLEFFQQWVKQVYLDTPYVI